MNCMDMSNIPSTSFRAANKPKLVLNPQDLLEQVLVQCPNSDVCRQVVPRSLLPTHLRDWCQAALTTCPSGCGFYGKRADIQTHHRLRCSLQDGESSVMVMSQRIERDSSASSSMIQGASDSSNSADKKEIVSRMKKRPKSQPASLYPLNRSSYSTSNRIIEGVVCVIEMELSEINDNIGLRLVGGKETALQHIYVQSVESESIADRDGRIQSGDQVLEINNCDLTQLTHDEAIEIIQTQLYNCCNVSMSILRQNNTASTRILSVELKKKENEILGIKMGGISGQPGVYIHDILKNTEAHRSSQFRKFDRVLQINDTSTLDFSQESVMKLINNIQGQITIFVARTEENVTLISDADNDDEADFYMRSELGSNSNFVAKEKLISISKCLGQSLGLTIAGGIDFCGTNTPIYIADISPTSVLLSNFNNRHSNAGIDTNSRSINQFSGHNNCPQYEYDSRPLLTDSSSQNIYGNCYGNNDNASYHNNEVVASGDVLLSVNNVDLLGIRHSEAVSALKSECERCEKIDLRVLKTNQNINQSNHISSRPFQPHWSFWFQLPSYYHFPQTVLVTKVTQKSNIGLSIVGGIDTITIPQQFVSPCKRQGLPVISRGFTTNNALHLQVMIKSILKDSPAYKCKLLKCGDILLSVDDKDVTNMPHSQIVRTLRNTSNTVKLKVIRWPGSQI